MSRFVRLRQGWPRLHRLSWGLSGLAVAVALAYGLLVNDDGRGFDPQAPPPRRGGLGLRGVQARTGYLGGQVRVRSQPGHGTTITVELPV